MCGLARLAVLEPRVSLLSCKVETAHRRFQRLGDVEGHSDLLERGWPRIPSEAHTATNTLDTGVYTRAGTLSLIRVQWIGDEGGPFDGWRHRAQASAHKHFIDADDNGEIFCNEDGSFQRTGLRCTWHHRSDTTGTVTCVVGRLTSYIEVIKRPEACSCLAARYEQSLNRRP